MATDAPAIYTVSVRDLVEFVLRRGDLGSDRDFVGSDRALAGTRGHQRIQRSRPVGYRKEIIVSQEVAGEGLTLRIQGRIDGVLTVDDEVWIEEIKTVRRGWNRTANPLHWAQVRLYGFMWAEAQRLPAVRLRLVYLDLDTQEISEFTAHAQRGELAQLFREVTACYRAWVEDRHRWSRVRDASISALVFPFDQYRPGQRDIAVAAYRAFARGGRLFVEAPTGIGKTAAVLFAALKALAEDRIKRIYYLTARTMGRAVAEQALKELRAVGLRLRSVTLTARDKLCAQEGRSCDPAACPLARGYYDRRHAAMREALAGEDLTRARLEAVSRQHQVCPFELSLEVSLWVDLLVGDYNHAFDPGAHLRGHFGEDHSGQGFLVDEAHNLADRAREMFSAELASAELREVGRRIRPMLPRCARALRRLQSALADLGQGAPSGAGEIPSEAKDGEFDLFAAPPPVPGVPGGQRVDFVHTAGPPHGGQTVLREFPGHLLELIDAALTESEAWLMENQPAEFRPCLLELYFRLQTFRRAGVLYDERFVTLVHREAEVRVRLYCLDPARGLRSVLDRGHGTVFFSATFTPPDYYRSLLGGDRDDPWLRVGSPFPAEHLAVLVQDRIRTQLEARSETLMEVVEVIAVLTAERPGNYLVYFPSYQYLAAVREAFQASHPNVTVRSQQPGMSETERAAFLSNFQAMPGLTQVGFAVLGGIFGEGIDLVGDRLIGVVVVGVGLPQLCLERDQIKEYFQQHRGAGFDYAYTFPGMNRVLQATGRVIRSEADRGVVLLVDTRFAQGRYRRLFPPWWHPQRVGTVAQLRSALARFWADGRPSPKPEKRT